MAMASATANNSNDFAHPRLNVQCVVVAAERFMSVMVMELMD
jgi:pyrimidine deaminase RibD-like protein